jgi:hypothetical protein
MSVGCIRKITAPATMIFEASLPNKEGTQPTQWIGNLECKLQTISSFYHTNLASPLNCFEESKGQSHFSLGRHMQAPRQTKLN